MVSSGQSPLHSLKNLLTEIDRLVSLPDSAEKQTPRCRELLAAAIAMVDELNRQDNPWEPIFQQAVRWHESGNLAEAGSLFGAIIEHNPGHFPSLHRLAAIRRYQNRLEDSLALLERALAANPGSADVHNTLGNTLNSLGRREEAIEHYRRAITLRENFPEAHLHLGNTLKALNRFEEAIEAYQAAIALQPRFAEAHSNLGIVLARLNRFEDAIACFQTALQLNPAGNMVYSNLGAALTSLNRHEEALRCFQGARQLEPDSAQLAFNEAVVHLAMGDFERGWPDYEARWRIAELKVTPRNFAQPLWDGQSDIAGKTILLHAEQGLGDMILLSRFVPLVIERGARVLLEVQAPLVGLMRAIPRVAQVVVYGDTLPAFELHAPFASLPMLFKTTVESIPARTPYLTAPGESDAIVDVEKPDDESPLVGVCWAGNPSYSNDHNRSIPLSIFQRLFDVAGVRFISLQQNFRPGDEALLARRENIDLTSVYKGGTLEDTAALISRLDLVITVDTAICHLAGALGKPVWILLPFSGYWVWLRERTDSPWYPTARLFRQSEIGDWESVMERVAQELKRVKSQNSQKVKTESI